MKSSILNKIIFDQEKFNDFCLKTLWEDNPNLSIDEISGPGKEEWPASIEKKGKKDKKPKMVVIRSDSLNLKEQQVILNLF